MNAGRTILAGVYLLMMVLLPLAHLVVPAHDATPAPHSACCNHDAPQETPSNEPARHGHDHAHCPLCKLLLLPGNTCDTAVGVVVASEPLPVFQRLATLHGVNTPPAEQARAPPCLTV